VNRHWKVVALIHRRPVYLGRSPRVKQVASSVHKHGVVAVAHNGKVYRYLKGKWSVIPSIRLDQVGLSKNGEICGTYGRNFYIQWGGKKAPSSYAYRKYMKTSSLYSPEGVDKNPLLKDPFSLSKYRPHRDNLSPYAPATPDTSDPSKAYVRDNLPLSTLDFQSLTPRTPPGQFQSYSYRHDPQNDALLDPLPDPK